MATPQVPPRPQRAQAGPTAVSPNMPQVPPRPSRIKNLEAERDASSRSPLNMLPGGGVPIVQRKGPTNELTRPPNVSLPSIGQEGLEYTSYDQLPAAARGVSGAQETAQEPKEQVVHASGLPIHAPKASLSQSAAKAQIAPVTRTDSTAAVAAGLPGPATQEEHGNEGLRRVTSRSGGAGGSGLSRVTSREPYPLREKTSFNRSSSSLNNHSTPKPPSIYGTDDEEEHGIPQIGMQIPLYPNAGDVQAPSPAPTQTQFTPGLGFFNDGSGRNHHRKRSSRTDFRFEDQYGRTHEHVDQFERDWAKRHPEQARREGFLSLLPRPESALSSEQLNKLVRGGDDIGMGAGAAPIGTPSQEVGWAASDEFATRLTSPKPSPASYFHGRKRSSSGQQPTVGSPLRTSIQAEEGFPLGRKFSDENALESEDDVIHIGQNVRPGIKITGGGRADGAIDLGPQGGNTNEHGSWIDEKGYGTPILASDEIIKRPGSSFMQPAVPPEHGSETDDDPHYPSSRRNSSQPVSRPSSRPGSIHGGIHGMGGPLGRLVSHDDHRGSGHATPLEEIEEYEPLFPDDEELEAKIKAQKAVAKKRPHLAHHHFPSQDIWEDTADSLKYTTTVQSPEPSQASQPAAPSDAAAASSAFETAEDEQRRKDQNDVHDMTSDSKTFAKPHFRSTALDEVSRPGLQRFPSSDIWEDTPESMLHVTTVSGPQEPEIKSPEDAHAIAGSLGEATAAGPPGSGTRPRVPERPIRRSKLAFDITDDIQPESDTREREVPDLGVKDVRSTKGAAPMVPDRPKPTVPARPARKPAGDSADGAPLDKVTSSGSTGSQEGVKEAPVVSSKAKPTVPSRPAGGKIAALQAGFMQDLNSRLKLGPQGPPPKAKEAEPEVQEPKEPLVDARKGRAKGPPRRKPASSGGMGGPSGLSFFSPTTVWTIDENEELNLHAEEQSTEELEKILTHHSTHNSDAAAPASPEASFREPIGATSPETTLAPHQPSAIGHEGDVPDPSITEETVEDVKTVQPELEKALSGAEAAPTSAEELQAQGAKSAATAVTGSDDINVDEESPFNKPEAGKLQDGGVSVPTDGDEAGNMSAKLV